ncbi:hypothetical protein [Arthrobacter sp. 24S4-2]|uniref:hypothetical protein n=1 Tax=Arthrobacter sp. 24S4-2 TaxID=2575374 RepID=UPI0020C7D23E|nr:hypothetical protein [Arthrobacter sp. 24S4-2]
MAPSLQTKEFDVNTPAPVAGPATTAPPPETQDQTQFAGRRATLLISTLLLGVLSFQLNARMVTPALPQIAASFGLILQSRLFSLVSAVR